METTPIRVAMMSYAHTGHAVAYSAALQQIAGAELAAIYDDDAARGQTMADRFSVSTVTTDPGAIFARDDIQAVIVCNETNRHVELVTAAAAAGKHVLCEKPIATTLADARAMIDACDTAGVQFHIPFVLRFMPMIHRAKQMIDNGKIGEVYGMMGGNRGIPPLAPAYPAWITDPVQAGGGALMDHSVHVTDVMRYLTGAEATRVSAESGTLFRNELAVDDGAILLVTFDDAIAASVDPSWCIPQGHPYHYDFYLRILGSKGLIVLDETKSALQLTRTATDGRPVVSESFAGWADLDLLRHFVDCVRDGEFRAPAASGADGLRSLEIALAAYESAETGQPVNIVRSV